MVSRDLPDDVRAFLRNHFERISAGDSAAAIDDLFAVEGMKDGSRDVYIQRCRELRPIELVQLVVGPEETRTNKHGQIVAVWVTVTISSKGQELSDEFRSGGSLGRTDSRSPVGHVGALRMKHGRRA